MRLSILKARMRGTAARLRPLCKMPIAVADRRGEYQRVKTFVVR